MSLGSRVYYTATVSDAPIKSVGTIRYVGSIPPTAGEWLGIEWDDPTRGKHDGVYDKTGVRYFECRSKPSSTSASFVRPSAKGIEYGQSFARALKAKYLDVPSHDTASTPLPSRLDHSPSAEASAGSSQYYDTLSNFKVEVVDLSKIKKTKLEDLQKLKQVGLEWEGVKGTGLQQGSSAEEEHLEVIRTLQALEKLDLSYSLVPTFQSVAEIVQGLTRLRHLALKYCQSIHNTRCSDGPARFLQPQAARFECDDDVLGRGELSRFNFSVLGLTQLTRERLKQIIHLSPSLPNLEELQLGDNDLVRLDSASTNSPTGPTPVVLPKLKILNLTRNRLESWDNILSSIRNIISVESLVLSYNALPDLASSNPSPRLLKHLSISHNSLASLANLPSTLTSLELSQNPCFAQAGLDESTLRMVMIALYSELDRFERTNVSKPERRDTEIWWVEKMGKGEGRGLMRGLLGGEDAWVERRMEELRKSEWSSELQATVSAETDNTCSELPKVHHLEPPTPIAAPTRPNPRSRLLNLSILLPPSLLTPQVEPLTKSLSILPTLRTLLLRTQISKFIGNPLPKTKYRLVALLRTAEGKELVVPIPLGEEGRLVGWWGLQDGDAVRVEEV
ncbi:BQ2448_5872 [Microbotryum intermedium]|uniref:BQ2448_5872 protein n=1 Tax=Microbotryum intermedium TaxID=269621 RepID=A0A238F817_9BASI|nr:BQ2448_5872 [Microbotryum intermedium]